MWRPANQAGLEEIAETGEELIQTGSIRRRQREKIQKRKPEQYLASDGKPSSMLVETIRKTSGIDL